MMKTLLVGVWACLIALAASYETSSVMRARANRPARQSAVMSTQATASDRQFAKAYIDAL